MSSVTETSGDDAAPSTPTTAIRSAGFAGSTARAAQPARSLWGRLPLSGRISLCFLVFLLCAALLAPWLTPYPNEGAGEPNMANKLLAPTAEHLFGTDHMGRDIVARVLYGARTSLMLAALVIAGSVTTGAALGLIAGYAGGWTDEVAMRITDVFLAFPPLLLAILLVTVLGGGFTSVVVALAVAWWPAYALLIRGEVVALRQRPFVEAARATGVPPLGILRRHLLPNALTPLLVQATVDFGAVVLVAAGLSFIGLGPEPPTADWGIMVNEGRSLVLGGQWWVAAYPGSAIMLTAVAFALLGDAILSARAGGSAQ